ncbi:MAG: hypothetical protein KBT41_01910, partial [bacterium]|nr:hypothetical protein [Candidatus Colousia faecequi]
NIAHYDPDMTMGDLRGKILFIARSENWRWYDIGAKAADWGADKEIYYKGKDGSVQKSIITVQDNYGPNEGESNGDYISEKRSDFKALWDLKSYTGTNQQYNDPTLVVNQASGFVLDQAFPDYLSACNDLYNDFVGYASSENIGRGIILQDYAGRGETKRISAGAAEACAAVAFAIPLLPRKLMLKAYLALAELAASEKETYGQKLVDAVIDNNFKNGLTQFVIIRVQSANEEQGTVDIDGTGEKMAEVKLVGNVFLNAYPKDGYSFMKWVNSNGETVSNDATTELRAVIRDDIFTAHFGETWKVTVDVDPQCQTMVDEDRGPMLVSNIIGSFASCEQSGTTRVYQVFQNDEISLVDGAHSGHEPVSWTDSKGKTYGPDECSAIKIDGNEHFTMKLKRSANAKKLTVKVSDGYENCGGVKLSLIDNEKGINYDLKHIDNLSNYFAYNSTYTLEADNLTGTIAKPCYYYFKCWTDSKGNQYRDKKISGTLTSDVKYTAEFGEKGYWVTASLAAGVGSGWGSTYVDREGCNELFYSAGDIATFTATPASGCSFVCWRNKATGEEFKDNPLSVKVDGDADYIAYFSKEVDDDMFMDVKYKVGDNKYIQFMKGPLVYNDGEPAVDDEQSKYTAFSWYYEMVPVRGEDIGYYSKPPMRYDKPMFAQQLYTNGGSFCRLLQLDEYVYLTQHYQCEAVDLSGSGSDYFLAITPYDINNPVEHPNEGIRTWWEEAEKNGAVALPLSSYNVQNGGVYGTWIVGDGTLWALRKGYYPKIFDTISNRDWTIYGASVRLVREVAE